MSHVTPAAHTRYRLYDLDLPLRIPGFAVGFAISKFKQNPGVLLFALQARGNEGAGAGGVTPRLGDAPAERDGNAFGKDNWRRAERNRHCRILDTGT
jgi:hypothetical protein